MTVPAPTSPDSSSDNFPRVRLAELLIVFLVALPVALALVQVQVEMTNHKEFSKHIMPEYVSG